jgi:hypothetical protein
MKRTKKKMPLHRDIFWVGKQWSVTGYGMQAIDQKLKGKFDIEVSRLWDDDLDDAPSEEKWFNAKDFDKGLLEARKHYPKPPEKASLKAVPEAVLNAAPKAAPKTAPVLVARASPDVSGAATSESKPVPAPANLTMRLEGCRAKFLTTWRVRVH